MSATSVLVVSPEHCHLKLFPAKDSAPGPQPVHTAAPTLLPMVNTRSPYLPGLFFSFKPIGAREPAAASGAACGSRSPEVGDAAVGRHPVPAAGRRATERDPRRNPRAGRHALRGRLLHGQAHAHRELPGAAPAWRLPDQDLPPERVAAGGGDLRQHAQEGLEADAWPRPRAAGGAMPANRSVPGVYARRAKLWTNIHAPKRSAVASEEPGDTSGEDEKKEKPAGSDDGDKQRKRAAEDTPSSDADKDATLSTPVKKKRSTDAEASLKKKKANKKKGTKRL
ncbi:hypothetical protein ON010_g2139 [Phytophthora cinnamomi]|nr:hypothetical protein ON010_g2139 [Phytophthora cinnamomi]